MAYLIERDLRLRTNRKAALEAELARMAATLERVPGVRRVILHGSLAAGDVGRASDIDLIVVMETDEPFFARIDTLNAMLEPRVATDLLVYTPEEFERLMVERAFIRRAVGTGRVVYAS